MIHEVKCRPEYFAALANGTKPFEVRKNDRPYQIGDFLAVNEFAPFDYQFGSEDERERFSRVINGTGRYSGDCLLFKITYILDDPQFCKDGMVVIGLACAKYNSFWGISPPLNAAISDNGCKPV